MISSEKFFRWIAIAVLITFLVYGGFYLKLRSDYIKEVKKLNDQLIENKEGILINYNLLKSQMNKIEKLSKGTEKLISKSFKKKHNKKIRNTNKIKYLRFLANMPISHTKAACLGDMRGPHKDYAV